jgi:photosystem II stability/assembly factor-like uncharacterized protein
MKRFFYLMFLIFAIFLTTELKSQSRNNNGNDGFGVPITSIEDDTSWIRVSNGPSAILKSIIIRGSYIFASTLGGGIYRSTDNGESWSLVNNGLPSATVRVMITSGPNIFGATDGAGVVLSTNNGYSWAQVNNGLSYTTLQTITRCDTNIFAATDYGGVDISTDYGVNWQKTGTLSSIVNAMIVNSSNIFAGINGKGVYLSTDNGTNWTAANNGLTDLSVKSLAVSDSNVFVGTWGGYVFVSSNNGLSWTKISNGLPSGSNINSLLAVGSNIIAATSKSGIYVSTDNGANWIVRNEGLPTSTFYLLAIAGSKIFAGTASGFYVRSVSDLFTLPAPAMPRSSPATNIAPKSFTANWNSSDLATGYFLDVATDNQFTNILSEYNNIDVGNVADYNVSDLGISNQYYYRIRAYNINGISANSDFIKVGKATIYTVTTSASPTIGGTTAGADSYFEGSNVTVTTTPNTGYKFTNWTENGLVVSAEASYSFEIYGDRNLVANFVRNVFTITTSSNSTSYGTTSGMGSYYEGANVTVTAIPNTGYKFLNWTENGLVVSSDANYSFNVENDRNLVANFIKYIFTVTTSSNPTSCGTTSGSGAYSLGASVQVDATPYAGYVFFNWTENGIEVSTEQNYSFTIMGDRNLVANFATQPKLAVSPLYIGVNSNSGTGSFNVSNATGGSMNWTAISNASWVKVLSGSSGTNQGIITVSYEENTGDSRVGTITITSPDANDSPQMVEVRQQAITDVEIINSIPQEFMLLQNYPNPFNPTTKIQFGIPKETSTILKVFDVLGNEVETLIHQYLLPGIYNVTFNASKLNNGIYFYRLNAGDFNQTRKMLLVK